MKAVLPTLLKFARAVASNLRDLFEFFLVVFIGSAGVWMPALIVLFAVKWMFF